MKERRRSTRKEVLETFQVFLVVPSRGIRRMQIRDISDHGMAFVADGSDGFKPGEALDTFFYVNPSLRIPLRLEVKRVTTDREPVIGAELDAKDSAGVKVFFSFLHLLDELASFI